MLFEQHTANLSQVDLFYRSAGSLSNDDVVVLLHGWPQTSYEWRHIMPTLLDAGYSVVAPDLRGLGDSSRPKFGYEKHIVAADIAELLHHLGVKRFFLVGHDFGAATAYPLAQMLEKDIRALVILDMLIPGFGLEQAMQVTENGGLWHLAFHAAAPDVAEMLVTGKERDYLSWFFTHFAHQKDAITPTDLDEYARCYSAPGALRAGFQYYQTMFKDAQYNKELAKTRLNMLVLALGGEFSLHEKTKNCMEQLATTVSGGVFTNAGHWIAEEQPAVLSQKLLEFFSFAKEWELSK